MNFDVKVDGERESVVVTGVHLSVDDSKSHDPSPSLSMPLIITTESIVLFYNAETLINKNSMKKIRRGNLILKPKQDLKSSLTFLQLVSCDYLK